MVQSKLLLKFKNIKHYYFDRYDSFAFEKYQIKTDNLITVEQVHGARVVLVNNNKNTYLKNYDGTVTTKPLFLGISTADCLPIFFYDPKKIIIAAIHAGWKGLSSGILKNVMAKIKKIGGHPEDIVVAVGPHIRVCCYTVPLSRVQKFKRAKKIFSFTASVFRNSLWHLDLEKIALMQMINLGIPKEQIDILPFCTSCDIRFNSYRRDGASCSRMLNIIGRLATGEIL